MPIITPHSSLFAHRLNVPSYGKPQGVGVVVGTVARAPLLVGELPHLHLPDTINKTQYERLTIIRTSDR